MNEDPIVSEVRRIREEIARECDYDIAKISARQRRFFPQWKGKKPIAPLHPEWRPPHAAVVAEGKVGYSTKDGKPE